MSIHFENKNIIITDPCYIINHYENERPKLEDYPELDGITESTPFKDYTPEQLVIYNKYKQSRNEFDKEHNDWSKCNCGKNMHVLGINHYICRGTIYGDWSCTTFNTDTNEKIGQFCADAGLVAVFDLDEVLAYNPNFKYHITKPWTTTLIKNFT